jgi:hypothetical protein
MRALVLGLLALVLASGAGCELTFPRGGLPITEYHGFTHGVAFLNETRETIDIWYEVDGELTRQTRIRPGEIARLDLDIMPADGTRTQICTSGRLVARTVGGRDLATWLPGTVCSGDFKRLKFCFEAINPRCFGPSLPPAPTARPT